MIMVFFYFGLKLCMVYKKFLFRMIEFKVFLEKNWFLNGMEKKIFSFILGWGIILVYNLVLL